MKLGNVRLGDDDVDRVMGRGLTDDGVERCMKEGINLEET